jgi:hypothetical protein
MGVGEDRQEMSFESLDCTFCFIGSFVVWCDHLPFDAMCVEVVLQGSWVFVVQNLYLMWCPWVRNH